ncbi:peptidase S14 [Pseudoflavonifractor sp. An176]|uniref:ClpP family protease n=1 Tax=Pseudoflavonifractor sp. An176 TaxID=1965572 RepID=UPI000B36817B|nr:ATP-dependent Clp protease proteolytic subunit [Pseudoflavonifractor sp. An176]OUP66126.1 peptidase S14 [Pseudoflavonifractor sp. An176]
MKKEDNSGGTQPAEEQQQQLTELGASMVKTGCGTIQTITIIGQIEGHQEAPEGAKTTKYEHVLPLLTAVEESDEVDGLLILLNTMGGDIEAGLAIAEMIAGMSKPTVSLVLGGGHSIGVPLAVSAKESFIVPSGAMTIHPVRLNGMVIGVSQTFHYFQRVQERILDFVTHNSAITRERLEKLMLNTQEMAADMGSIVYGQQAVELGLIDHLGGLSDAMACLRKRMKKYRKK